MMLLHRLNLMEKKVYKKDLLFERLGVGRSGILKVSRARMRSRCSWKLLSFLRTFPATCLEQHLLTLYLKIYCIISIKRKNLE